MSLPTTSVAPAVVEQLKALLATALAGMGDDGSDPTILGGFAAGYSTWDTVVMGDQVEGVHRYNNMRAGRKPRQESFIQHVWFRVIRSGAEQTAAQAAAYAQLAKLEDIIADDPGIGLGDDWPTLVLGVQAFHANTTQEGGSQGWLANIRADVSVDVRLD